MKIYPSYCKEGDFTCDVTRVSDVYKLTFPLAHMFIAVVTAMCQDGGEVQPGAGLQRHV